LTVIRIPEMDFRPDSDVDVFVVVGHAPLRELRRAVRPTEGRSDVPRPANASPRPSIFRLT
jgi:predicted nucleotidyltransferase